MMNAMLNIPGSLPNIPLTTKERIRLCHAFLSRNSAEYRAENILGQMKMAKMLCDRWNQHPHTSIEDEWNSIQFEKDQQQREYAEYAKSIVDPETKIGDSDNENANTGTSEDTTGEVQKEQDTKEAHESDTPGKAENESKTQGGDSILSSSTSKTENSANQSKGYDTFSLNIELNAKQRLAVDFAASGKSFVLTGPAGSGKTTAEREIVKALLARSDIGKHTFKDKRSGQRVSSASIAVVSFTNKAANNSAKAILKDPSLSELAVNITTIHNLLEYQPEFFTRDDGSEGMRFVPARNEFNPLTITHLLIEEGSNVGAHDLYQALYAAMRPGICIIIVGDINQLPPVFSPSILNYALVQLPVVELTEIYRQALDSPIIGNAHRILRGEPLVPKLPYFAHVTGKHLEKLPSEAATVNKLMGSLKKWVDTPDPSSNGEPMYDPDQDIILSPYNVNDAGTNAINNHVAQFLGVRRNAEVFEIIAGMNKVYLSVGDRVFSFKREGIVTKISRNAQYIGRRPKEESTHLTRWGIYVNTGAKESDGDFELECTYENMNVDDIPAEDDVKRAASHIVTVQYDDGTEDTLRGSGDFSTANFSLGYALTIHKSQGSEWRKVFIMLHKNHIRNVNREMLYTAVTRARTHCMVIDHCDIFSRALEVQRVKGNTVEEKIQWFNSKISLVEPVSVLKN